MRYWSILPNFIYSWIPEFISDNWTVNDIVPVVIKTWTFLHSDCTRVLEIILLLVASIAICHDLLPTNDLKTTFFNVQLNWGTTAGDNGKIEYRCTSRKWAVITILWKFNETRISTREWHSRSKQRVIY